MKLTQGTAKARTNGTIPTDKEIKPDTTTQTKPISSKEVQKEFNGITKHLPIEWDVPMDYLNFWGRLKARAKSPSLSLGISVLALLVAIGSIVYAIQKPQVIKQIIPQTITKYITKVIPQPASKAKNVVAPNIGAKNKVNPSPNASSNPKASPARNRTAIRNSTGTRVGNPNRNVSPAPRNSSSNRAYNPPKKQTPQPKNNLNQDDTPNQSSQKWQKDPDSSYAEPDYRPPSSNNNNQTVTPADDPVVVIQ